MKVLLVNPYIYDFTAFDLWLRPLGLLYLAAVIESYSDCQIYWLDLLDRFQEPNPMDFKKDGRGKFHKEIVEKPEIFKNIPRNYSRYGIPLSQFQDKLTQLPDIDIIFVTTMMTFWVDGVKFTAEILKKRFPGAQLVLGGILPTLVPVKILKKYVAADIYVAGAGENQILQIINQMGGHIFPSPDFSQIDSIPSPAYGYLGSQKILPLITSRGCPFNCTYCASNLINRKFIQRSYESIVDEIKEMVAKYQTEHFVIFDDAFLYNKHKRFFPFMKALNSQVKAKFHTPNGLHVREIDEFTSDILFKNGFQTIRLGFESISADILARSSNKVNSSQMFKAVENLERAGFKRNRIEVYLLFGIPGQQISDLKDALIFARDLGVIPRLSYYSPIPQTVDFKNLQKNKILSSEINPYETNKIYFIYEKSNFSQPEIQSIKELTSKITSSLRD